jgi:hypothetical protein
VTALRWYWYAHYDGMVSSPEQLYIAKRSGKAL